MANGEHVSSKGVCTGLTIHTTHNAFLLDCYSIPLAGFDIILGVQWLSSLGPILWDFKLMTLSFHHHGQQVTCRGMQSSNSSFHSHTCASTDLMAELLDEFEALFSKPHWLPPIRSHDHRIRLAPDTASIAVRPYHYPHI